MQQFKTKIYIANTDSLEDKALFDMFYSTVNKKRQEKIDKIRFDKDKRLSLGAQVLLENALDNIGIDYKKAEFVYGENKKPYLKGNPVYFNLSHSGSFAVCAVSCGEVGVDIELIENANFSISKRIFSNNELEILNLIDDEEAKKREFIRLWTLKESYMKYCGSGLTLSPKEIAFEFTDNKPQYKNLSFFEYEINGYFLSCCTKENCFEEGLTFVDYCDINFQQKMFGN